MDSGSEALTEAVQSALGRRNLETATRVSTLGFARLHKYWRAAARSQVF